MNTEDPDIVEMDFPPYVEEYPPFPDIEPDSNFEDNKEEIYLRNTELAKEINAMLAAEERRKIAAKKAEFEKIYNDAYRQAYKDAQQKLAVQQQNYPTTYRSGSLFNFIEDFLSLFSPNRTVDLNKMSWQIVRACVVIAFIIFLMIVGVRDG
ncbi:MAG: hypothetical protein K2K44_02660 [Oscillospiraceae bacterium]|nr:hypothetical protein [Oscillospiraceae bacterium]